MKNTKLIIGLMIVVSVISLILSVLLEFNIVLKSIEHKDYYINLLMGIFVSGILVILTSVTQFIFQKRDYYIRILRAENNLVFLSLNIMTCMEEHSQDSSIYQMFDEFDKNYQVMSIEFIDSCYFFKASSRDKLIESIAVETTRFIMIQNELLKYAKDFKDNKISQVKYNTAFECIREALLNDYKDEFIHYRELLEEEIKKIIKDRGMVKWV